MSVFRFKQFEMENTASAMKVGTDSVLLGAAAELGDTRKVLDIGTGTGAVALMIAQRLGERNADYKIDAIDIDGASAREAAENFARSPWKDNLQAFHCPLQEWQGEGYDLIVSNPPFFDESLRNPDSRRSAARHTESLSYREIMAYASGALAPGGRVALILPAEVEKDLLRTAGGYGFYPRALLRVRTTARKPVKRIIAELSAGRTDMEPRELLMMEDGVYTLQYRSIVGPFLLNL